MVDVKNKIKCLVENCLKRSNFNFDSETKGIYCAQHKKQNMVNVMKKLICLKENCLKQPSFNFDSEIKGI